MRYLLGTDERNCSLSGNSQKQRHIGHCLCILALTVCGDETQLQLLSYLCRNDDPQMTAVLICCRIKEDTEELMNRDTCNQPYLIMSTHELLSIVRRHTIPL